MNKYNFIEDELLNLEKNNLIREIRTFRDTQSTFSNVNNNEILLFSSSNYLSLIEDRDIIDNAYKEACIYGTGSGGSRLTTGNSILHEKLETIIAEFIGYEESIVFSSGYNTNVGVISAIADRNTEIFSDEKNHASIIDGCRMSSAKITKYKHLNMEDLEEKLKNSENIKKIIISDGVFSMDGDILDLKKFVELADKYNALSIVDDAHGFGVIGESGKGITELYGVKPDILIGTLSKAVGSEGGFAATDKKIKKYLQNKSRSYIFSTSLSPFSISASYYAIKKIKENNKLVKALQRNIKYFTEELNKNKIIVNSKSAIIKIPIGNEKSALEISKKLWDRKIYIPAIRFPAVDKNKAILRITIMKNYTKKDMDYVISNLTEILKEYGI